MKELMKEQLGELKTQNDNLTKKLKAEQAQSESLEEPIRLKNV